MSIPCQSKMKEDGSAPVQGISVQKELNVDDQAELSTQSNIQEDGCSKVQGMICDQKELDDMKGPNYIASSSTYRIFEDATSSSYDFVKDTEFWNKKRRFEDSHESIPDFFGDFIDNEHRSTSVEKQSKRVKLNTQPVMSSIYGDVALAKEILTLLKEKTWVSTGMYFNQIINLLRKGKTHDEASLIESKAKDILDVALLIGYIQKREAKYFVLPSTPNTEAALSTDEDSMTLEENAEDLKNIVLDPSSEEIERLELDDSREDSTAEIMPSTAKKDSKCSVQ